MAEARFREYQFPVTTATLPDFGDEYFWSIEEDRFKTGGQLLLCLFGRNEDGTRYLLNKRELGNQHVVDRTVIEHHGREFALEFGAHVTSGRYETNRETFEDEIEFDMASPSMKNFDNGMSPTLRRILGSYN